MSVRSIQRILKSFSSSKQPLHQTYLTPRSLDKLQRTEASRILPRGKRAVCYCCENTPSKEENASSRSNLTKSDRNIGVFCWILMLTADGTERSPSASMRSRIRGCEKRLNPKVRNRNYLCDTLGASTLFFRETPRLQNRLRFRLQRTTLFAHVYFTARDLNDPPPATWPARTQGLGGFRNQVHLDDSTLVAVLEHPS